MLSDPHRLRVTVAHYPSGASKWNPIEHRLVSAISSNWRGRPLDSWETILNYIRTTTTETGLRVRSVLVERDYPTGVKISKQQMATLNLVRNTILPNWNYDLKPREPPAAPDDAATAATT